LFPRLSGLPPESGRPD